MVISLSFICVIINSISVISAKEGEAVASGALITFSGLWKRTSRGLRERDSGFERPSYSGIQLLQSKIREAIKKDTNLEILI